MRCCKHRTPVAGEARSPCTPYGRLVGLHGLLCTDSTPWMHWSACPALPECTTQKHDKVKGAGSMHGQRKAGAEGSTSPGRTLLGLGGSWLAHRPRGGGGQPLANGIGVRAKGFCEHGACVCACTCACACVHMCVCICVHMHACIGAGHLACHCLGGTRWAGVPT